MAKVKLTHEQRKKAIDILIEMDIDGSNKYRDRYYQFYEGILPYKNLSSVEIIETFEDMEMDLPN